MASEVPASLRWPTVCRHKIRGVRTPYLLIVQHHLVPSKTRLVARVVVAHGIHATLLAPRITVGSVAYRALLLDITSLDGALIGQTVAEAEVDEDAVTDGLDAIFRGYPVGLPI